MFCDVLETPLCDCLDYNLSDVYNALTIHGLATAGQLPKSVLDVTNFWKSTSYSIGGMVFSLDDIEHGILRGTVGSFCFPSCSKFPGINPVVAPSIL